MENDIVRMLFLRRQWQKKRWKIKTISGTPPLSFKAKAGALRDYRIYGNTVDGESVGDRTANLFDVSTITLGCYINDVGQIIQNDDIDTSDFIKVSPNTNYTYKGAVSYISNIIRIAYYDQSKNFISRYFTPGNAANGETVTTPSNCEYVKLSYDNVITNLMLNLGSAPLPYEPYGYKVPVTVEGKNLFDEKYDAISPNSITYKAIYIGNNICTLSTDMPLNNTLGANLFLLTGNVSTGAATPTNGVYVNHSKTVASTNGYVTIAYRSYDITPIDYHTQLEKGSTATPYEPYQPPVTTSIYLPEQIKMVGDEAEYIDYREQKQHRVRKNLIPEMFSGWYYNNIGRKITDDRIMGSEYIEAEPGVQYTTALFNENFTNVHFLVINFYNAEKTIIGYYATSATSTSPEGTKFITVRTFAGDNAASGIFYYQLEKMATVSNYEPYIENTDLDVTLPALPTLTGTNVLTVGTAVQPSDVYIKGRIKKGE